MSKSVIQRLAVPSALVVAIVAAAGCSNNGTDDYDHPATAATAATMPTAPMAGASAYNTPGSTATAGMAPGMAPMPSAMAGDFAPQAATGGMLEIKLAELALSRSDDADVKTFAQKMKDDHMAIADKLKGIVGSGPSTAELPTSLTPAEQQVVNSVQSKDGDDFNEAYADAAVKNHQMTIDLFQKAATNASTPELQQFASDTLPMLKEHLRLAQELQSKVQGD